MAYLSINKLHVELERQKGGWNYRVLGYLVDRPAAFIAAILVGNNVALVLYGNYMHQFMEPYFEQWSAFDYLVLLAETSISTIIILVFAEFFAKDGFSAKRRRAHEGIECSAYLIFCTSSTECPSFRVSQFFLKYIFRIEAEEESNDFGRVELDHYVRERVPNTVEGDDEVDPELEIFKNALEFPETKAREFMIPRTEIEGVEVNSDLKEVHAHLSKAAIPSFLCLMKMSIR